MNKKRIYPIPAWLPLAVLLFFMLACNAQQVAAPLTQPPDTQAGTTSLPATDGTAQPVSTETSTSTPIVHTLTPGEPPAASSSEIKDLDSSLFAAERRTNGGESFATNRFERPFNANSMDVYFPDLDITKARLFRDSQWIFVNILLIGPNSAGGLQGGYGAEFDLDLNGRGDVLIMAGKPGPAWSTDRVRVWKDDNHDVGGAHPIQSDAPVNGDGYETLDFDQGVGADPDLAWARISPTDPNSAQLAFKRSLINDDDAYLWGAWAMNEATLNPAWFDYNDHFTAEQAGSPLLEVTQYYPIKAFAEVDNTCRWVVGFTPTGTEPGICPVPATPTPIVPAKINGLVYHDFDQNGSFNGADYGYPGINVEVREGGCGSPGAVVKSAVTNGSGNYSVTVDPGTYCVDVPAMPPDANRGTNPVEVTVGSGGTGRADFRFWYLIF